MKLLLTIFLFFTARFVSAQYGVTGGLSFLRPFGVQTTFVGLKLGGEIPRDNENSLYINASIYGQKRLNPSIGTTTIQLENIDPSDYSLNFVTTDSYFNYITLDGGNRYYLIDGYDSGFSLYGGSNLMGVLNLAKMKVSDYDQTKYRLPADQSLNGAIISMGVGFTGGAKYSVPAVGTFFLDMVADYMVLGISSNQTASTIGNHFYSQIIFSFNIGFRKDFY